MKVKKNDRTDPNLPANIEEDLEVLKGWAINLFPRHRSQVIDTDDLFQTLCLLYEEGKVNFAKKPRSIPIRVFVFKYIDFILRRTYRGQFKFENRDTIPVDEIIPIDALTHHDNELVDFKNRSNPYLFEDSYDLNRILLKYTYEERIVIYYRFFMSLPLKEVKSYLPPNAKLSYAKTRKLLIRLKSDKDLFNLFQEKE